MDEEPAADTWSGASGGRSPDNELTRADFRGQVRALFRRYIAAAEMGRLRDYQQAFIDRNELLAPAQRYWLVARLQLKERQLGGGADDPVAAGVDPFTENELRRVEAAVGVTR
jgi:hypothetical protein